MTVAVAALLASTAPAPATAKTTRSDPSITLERIAPVTAGHPLRVVGTVSHAGPRSDKVVTVQVRRDQQWRTVAVKRGLTGRTAYRILVPTTTPQTRVYRTVLKRGATVLGRSSLRRGIVSAPATRDRTANLQIRASDRERVAGCKSYDNIAWSVTAKPSTSWTLHLAVTRPDGSTSLNVKVTGTGAKDGRPANRMCGKADPAGMYGISATLSSARFATRKETNSFLFTDPASPAGAVLPDLQMKSLDACSSTERQRATDNHGSGCFYVQTDDTGKKLLKFAATTMNVGKGAMEVRSTRTDAATAGSAFWSGPAFQRIYTKDGFTDVASAAKFYWESVPNGATDSHGHQHWHIQDFDHYSIVGEPGAKDEKHGFCLQDNTSVPGAGQAVYPNETSCGYQHPDAASIVHGLSPGWGDTYPSSLPDQGIDISGLADGTYTVKVTADAQDLVRESDETNNSVAATVTIQGDRVTAASAQ